MSKDMKCPFCQRELHKDSDGYYTCYTDNCECMKYGGNGASGSESLWLTLIRTRKALDVAVDALKHYCTDSDNWSCIIDFTGDYDNTPSEYADKSLEQITALEQKE